MHLPRAQPMPDERPSHKPVSAPQEGADTARDPSDPWSRAIAAIDDSTRADALLDLARDTWVDLAATGRAPTDDEVRDKAKALALSDDDARTAAGDVLGVLGRGPEDDTERALGAALCARAIAREWSGANADDARLAGAAISLSARTPFDVLSGLDRVMGDPDRAWKATAARVRAFDRGEAKGMSRGEAAIACSAIASSSSTAAASARSNLRLRDPLLARIVDGSNATESGEKVELSGELLPAPRGAIATTLLALTGLLFVMHAWRAVLKLALVYRKPAEITLSARGVRIKSKTTLLGRTLRESDTHLLRDSLAEATREIRYPSLGLYAGLLALAIGTYVGVGTLSDGVRSASPSLLLVGLVVVAAGIGLDLALTSAAPGARGKCRVVFVAKKGRALCVGGLDSTRADEALALLKA